MRAIWTRLAPGIATLALALASGSVSAQFSSNPCAPGAPSGDFVTGGGFIIVTGDHANFGVAGGCKNDLLWGHLEYVDHNFSPQPGRVHGTEVLQYFADKDDPKTRWIGGRAEVNGASGFTYCVRVTDNGQGASDPADTFQISVSNGYTAMGPLMGGNIQLHNPDPDNTPKGDCMDLGKVPA